MFKKFRFYFSPFFLIRYYLRRDTRHFVKKYEIKGRILDLGCGQKPFRNIFRNSEYVGIDFENFSQNKDSSGGKPDFYFGREYENNMKLPFGDGSFNHCVSFQVLEHHPEPEIMAGEMARIVKKDGFILVSCPFIYALHEEPDDYQRLTHYKLKYIFEKNGCTMVEVKKQGTLFSAISMLVSEQANRFAAKNMLNYFISFFLLPFLLLLQYFSILMDFFVKPKTVFLNYLILAKKK